jgi:glycerol-3-phosphate acyltransferase PlsY
MTLFLGVLLSYLTGSIPTAYIFGKWLKNIDIRKHGSGNVGATNVFRVLGKEAGIAVLSLDILKGVIAVAVIADFLGLTLSWQRIILAVSVVAGHNWTIFLNFKGGKGIATSLGVLIGLTARIISIRPVLLATILVWVISFLATAIVSVASILAAITLPVSMVVTNQSFDLILLGVVFCIFVVFRHRTNIKRILNGQEPQAPLPFHKKKRN